MSIPLANLDGHLKRIMEDIPVTFVWKGVTAQGVRSTPNITETAIIGGQDRKIEYQIFVRRASLGGEIPTQGDYVDVFDANNVISKMIILGTRPSPDDAQLLALQMGFARVK